MIENNTLIQGIIEMLEETLQHDMPASKADAIVRKCADMLKILNKE